eukprot:g11461.t1
MKLHDQDAVMALRLNAPAGMKESQDYEALIAKAEERLQEALEEAQMAVGFADNEGNAQAELDELTAALASGREGKEGNDMVVFLRTMRRQIEDKSETW